MALTPSKKVISNAWRSWDNHLQLQERWLFSLPRGKAPCLGSARSQSGWGDLPVSTRKIVVMGKLFIAARIWPKKKWESSNKKKCRDNQDICLPSGRHSCCHNFQLEWLILVTPLRSISGCQHRFYSSGRSKQNKKPITYSSLSLFWWVSNSLASGIGVSAKTASAHSLKFKPTFPNVGAWDRTAGFIILTTSQVM